MKYVASQLLINIGLSLSLYTPLHSLFLYKSWNIWLIPVNPFDEYTRTASGAWNSSFGSKSHEKSKGLIPICALELLYISTSTLAKKFPLYIKFNPYTSPYSSLASWLAKAINGFWAWLLAPLLLSINWFPLLNGVLTICLSLAHAPDNWIKSNSLLLKSTLALKTLKISTLLLLLFITLQLLVIASYSSNTVYDKTILNSANLSTKVISKVSPSISFSIYVAGNPLSSFFPLKMLWFSYLKSVSVVPLANFISIAGERKSVWPYVGYSTVFNSILKLSILSVSARKLPLPYFLKI